MEGESHQPGMLYCRSCRKKFTVTVGTVFERSHIPLSKWLLAYHLMCASKKGISAHQLHRMLGITYKSAWFMAHRIRESMKPGDNEPPLGGAGRTVEADETFVGGKEKNKHANKRNRAGRGPVGKEAVLSLVERGGKVRSTHVPSVNSATLGPILTKQLHEETRLMTDEATPYSPLGKGFAEHHTVNHGIGEYVRGDAHTNTIEGYFSVFKRGIGGVYHHVSQQHLKRYLVEFDFRYNERSSLGIDDATRAERALRGAEGKRLTYNQSNIAA
jgi:transposase-like protein